MMVPDQCHCRERDRVSLHRDEPLCALAGFLARFEVIGAIYLFTLPRLPGSAVVAERVWVSATQPPSGCQAAFRLPLAQLGGLGFRWKLNYYLTMFSRVALAFIFDGL